MFYPERGRGRRGERGEQSKPALHTLPLSLSWMLGIGGHPSTPRSHAISHTSHYFTASSLHLWRSNSHRLRALLFNCHVSQTTLVFAQASSKASCSPLALGSLSPPAHQIGDQAKASARQLRECGMSRAKSIFHMRRTHGRCCHGRRSREQSFQRNSQRQPGTYWSSTQKIKKKASRPRSEMATAARKCPTWALHTRTSTRRQARASRRADQGAACSGSNRRVVGPSTKSTKPTDSRVSMTKSARAQNARDTCLRADFRQH